MVRLTGLLGVVIISFSAILVRLAGVSPGTASFFRGAYAVPLLFAAWILLRDRDHRFRRTRWLAVVAGVLLSIDLNFWHRSIDAIGAGLATVLGNTQVVFVGLAAWMLHRERPTRLALLTVPVVFVGVSLISGLGRPDSYGEDPVAGVLYGILTGVTFGGFILVFRASNRELAPAAGPLLDATVGHTIGSLMWSLFDSGFALTPHWPAHGWLLLLAWGPQFLGWLLISHALPRLAALETSVQILVQPMLTVLWGHLIFGEYLSTLQWIGVTLVLGGIGLLSVMGSVERSPSAERDSAIAVRARTVPSSARTD